MTSILKLTGVAIAITCAFDQLSWFKNQLNIDGIRSSSPGSSYRPWLGAMAEDAAGGKKYTEEELKQYDGTDPEKPILLAIDGTVFDVSVSPAFYGPGGHYHHFTGKDASRAWVTECWDSEDQLTWRMDGLEAMFMPKYLDESMEKTASGESDIEGVAAFGGEQMAKMAKQVIERFGKVTEKEREKRRKEDKVEAKEGVKNQLAHWYAFFSGNDKYKIVGTVVHDDNKPAPPEICEAAMKKRPMKGGKLDDIMKAAGSKGGIYDGGKMAPADKMPDFVSQSLNKKKGAPKTASQEAEEDDDLVRDEL